MECYWWDNTLAVGGQGSCHGLHFGVIKSWLSLTSVLSSNVMFLFKLEYVFLIKHYPQRLLNLDLNNWLAFISIGLFNKKCSTSPASPNTLEQQKYPTFSFICHIWIFDASKLEHFPNFPYNMFKHLFTQQTSKPESQHCSKNKTHDLHLDSIE